MKKILFALAVLAPGLALMTGGRTDYDHGAYLPVNTMVNNVEDVSGVVLLDRAVQYSVACPAIEETHLTTGGLQVIAKLRNRENRRIQVQAKCVFKDAEGFAVDETPYRNVFLDENDRADVPFVCASNKALRYTVTVRQAK